MDFGTHAQLVLLALLIAVAALLAAAPTLRIPYPILLVLGGLALGFVPGVPTVQLPPALVLVAILPPLLYSSAFFTSLRELRANIRPIGSLAIGLVLTTMVAVAVVAHALVDDMSWTAAFVLGAVVSPTDPIAATAIMRRLGVPRRTVSIVEGESLVNDGTALVLYRVAVTAAVAGTFSIWDASWRLLWSIAGGVAIGLIVGFIVAALRRRLDNPPVEVTIALLTGFSAAKLLWWGVLVTGTVVAARLVFVPVFTYLPRRFLGAFDPNNPPPPPGRAFVVSWAGMRGAVSLAAALAIPLTTNGGGAFPQRDLIVFLTFCVILGTLVEIGRAHV